MASEKVLQEKQAYVAELTGKLNEAVSGVVVSYKGINVADDTKLRKQLREAGVEYMVVKNTMLRRAADQAGLSALDDVLKGTTALAISATEYATGAKILADFAEKNKDFELKAGFVDGNVIDSEGVKSLAKMPSKEVLLAQVLGGLNTPIVNFAGVLNANLRGLVVALNALAEKQSA